MCRIVRDMTTTHPSREHYGVSIREARERAGLSLEKARDRLFRTIPDRYVPSSKTLHRIERGEVAEEKVDGLLIYGLAKVYGCRISDLSSLVAEEVNTLSDLLDSSLPWIPMCAGQMVLRLDELDVPTEVDRRELVPAA